MEYNSALLVEAGSLSPLLSLLLKVPKLEAEVMAMTFDVPTASIWLGGESILGTALIDKRGRMSVKVKQAFEALSSMLDAPLIVHQGCDDGLDGVARFEGGKFVGAARVDMFTGKPECVVFRGAKRRAGGEALAEQADEYLNVLLAEWAPLELRMPQEKNAVPVSLAARVDDSAAVTYGWMCDLPTTIARLTRGKLRWIKPGNKDRKETRAVFAALSGGDPPSAKMRAAKKSAAKQREPKEPAAKNAAAKKSAAKKPVTTKRISRAPKIVLGGA
ncbi:MAG: hypothetical protein SFX73_19870 [Kofleriaceae bacterium]|nr:hypothetical protein [Kofleriaceae bacterium]